jgi:hypothetical protein
MNGSCVVNFDTAWDQQDDGSGKSGIRQYLESLEAKVKAMEEREAKAKADAQKAVTSATFESLGIKPTVAALYQGEANPDAIKSWVSDMRGAFGAAPEQGSDQSQQQTSQQVQLLNGDQQQQYKQLVEAGQSAADTNTLTDVHARLAQATSRDELHQIWQSMN